jgi:hypothetical protein
MAISWVGRATNGAFDGNSITLTVPVGTAQDDIVYMAAAIGDDGGDYTLAMSTAGYSKLTELFADDTDDTNFAIFRKPMGATPDSTAVFTGQGGSDASVVGAMQVFRGVDLGTPQDATTTTATGVNSSIPIPPSITTVTANAWVLTAVGFAQNYAYAPGLPPAGYENGPNNDCHTARGDTEPAATGICYRTNPVVSPTTETPAAWNNTDAGTGQSWCAATLALRPAGAVAATSLLPLSMNPAMMSLLVR